MSRRPIAKAWLWPPDNVTPHIKLVDDLPATQRFDEVLQTIQQAQARKLDSFKPHASQDTTLQM